ncbi:MAG: hypothetical protein ACO24A_03470 [Burkholderiaceae bacterium]
MMIHHGNALLRTTGQSVLDGMGDYRHSGLHHSRRTAARIKP